jgi:multidrug efflux pump subunit AcrA (membrane-fusion protein)
VIWVKTDAGRAEMQNRALIKERARRNLLLLIDGVKSEEMLLANLAGITSADFQELRKLDLIAPAAGAVTIGNPARAANVEANRPTVPLPLDSKSLDYNAFTAALTKLISTHLGLRGFTLTLAMDKASTISELRDVAQRVIEQVRERKGEAAASEARKTLYGGG